MGVAFVFGEAPVKISCRYLGLLCCFALLLLFPQKTDAIWDSISYMTVQIYRSAPPPGTFSIPTSIAISPGGLVVADSGNDRIQLLQSELGNWIAIGEQGRKSGQFWQPVGIATYHNRIYVSDTRNHRIQILDLHGRFIASFGEYGSKPGQFIFPVGLDLDSVGNLYVADTANHRIQVFDANGEYLRNWGNFGDGPGSFAWPNDLAILDDLVYVVDTENHRIQVFDRGGNYQFAFGPSDSVPLRWPHGIATSGDLVYVADSGNRRVVIYTKEGIYQREFRVYFDPQRPDWCWPVDVAVDGYIYVVDSFQQVIQIYSAEGRYIGNLGTPTGARGRWTWPTNLCIGDGGKLYIADGIHAAIHRYDITGEYENSWGGWGSLPGEFEEFGGIAYAAGVVYVASGKSIKLFDSDGNFRDEWKYSEGIGMPSNQIDLTDLTIDSEGIVYALDVKNKEVIVFDPNGVFVSEWPLVDANGDFLVEPVVIEHLADSVLILDAARAAVYCFSTIGELVLHWGTNGRTICSLSNPRDIAVRDNVVYVVEHTAHRITVLDHQGQLLDRIGGVGTEPSAFLGPISIATDDRGALYVGEAGTARVQRLMPVKMKWLLPIVVQRGQLDWPDTYSNDNIPVSKDRTLEPAIYNLPDLEEDGAITIKTDNVILDCSGAQLIGYENIGFAISIQNAQNVTVRNCSATGYYYGLRAEKADGLRIENCNFSGNRVLLDGDVNINIAEGPEIDYLSALGGGIYIRDSTNCEIVGNTLVNQQNGIDLYNVSHSSIRSNNVSDNSGWGIHLHGSSNNVIAYNTAERVERPCGGPYIQSQCRMGGVSPGRRCGCDSAALLLMNGSHDNQVCGNALRYSGDGILGSIDTKYPICSNNNEFRENDGSFSPNNAFEFDFCSGNRFIGNDASFSNYGFWLGYSVETEVRGNRVEGNYQGIVIEHGHNNVIAENAVVDNIGPGIELMTDYDEWATVLFPDRSHSYGYTIESNVLMGNNRGLSLVGTTDSIVTGNLFCDNKISLRLAEAQIQSQLIAADSNTIADNDFELTAPVLQHRLWRPRSPLEAGIGWHTVTSSKRRQLWTDLPDIFGMFLQSDGRYHIFNAQGVYVNATYNWWGTTDEGEIERRIYDYTDDPHLGLVEYRPYREQPRHKN